MAPANNAIVDAIVDGFLDDDAVDTVLHGPDAWIRMASAPSRGTGHLVTNRRIEAASS